MNSMRNRLFYKKGENLKVEISFVRRYDGTYLQGIYSNIEPYCFLVGSLVEVGFLLFLQALESRENYRKIKSNLKF